MNNVLTLKNIGKSYKQYPSKFSRLVEWGMPFLGLRHKKKWVIRNINLEVKQGETVGIIGVNGAGKSTLLKMITGTTQPSEGEVICVGRIAALLELGMGFHPDFTGRQNVFMSGQLLGLSNETISELMEEILSFADIGDYVDMPCRVYSSGMQVRLAFSIATAVRPDILIVDEALSVGDVAFQAKCFRRISNYKEEGTTILFVTHALDDIVKHCHRAILLDSGSVAMSGEPREVVNEFRDRLFGKSKKKEIDLSKKNVDLDDDELSTIDIFHTKPLYQTIEHRWGTRAAEITDFTIKSNGSLYPTSLIGGEVVEIKFRCVFHQDIDSPIFGILLKTPDGINLYGASSRELMRDSIGLAKSGSAIDFTFKLKINFNTGPILISVGLTHCDEYGNDEPLDRRYDAVIINVDNEKRFIGLVDAETECVIEVKNEFNC
ncbi:ABC transporter ATP-binding protein [Erwinia sp. S63]|uniref:ABC transporter ATP-binding protein n=1 Tax=Erwinia sp. S63 TaxID=2769341 RepID=UPI00190DB389|nr:ABC transporter ATP-binding protein [Erwinia sp. S63]MBK0094564.1 ABC transporter ATP-binding protein [Erwinia sp. S63]